MASVPEPDAAGASAPHEIASAYTPHHLGVLGDSATDTTAATARATSTDAAVPTGAGPGGVDDTAATPPARLRLHFVDNVRVYLTVLVLAHHVALAYGNLPLWPYRENPTPGADATSAGLLDLLVILNQVFFMGFFFLLAGYFTPGSVDRKGPGPFARDRLLRLGVPLLGFVILLRPLYTLPSYLHQHADEPYWRYFFTSFDPGPLWFVEVLLVFGLGYAWLRHRRFGPPNAGNTARPLQGWQIVALAVVLGAISYLWRILVPLGMYVPVLGLPSAAYLPQYVGLFVVGVIAYRRNWFATLPQRCGWLGLGMIGLSALPLIAFGDPAASFTDGPDPTPGSLPTLGMALWDSLFGLGVILILFTGFRRFVTTNGRFARLLTRNAFAVYVIHPVVLVGVQVLLGWLELPAVLKFVVVLALAAPLCWILAAGVRRWPWAKRVL